MAPKKQALVIGLDSADRRLVWRMQEDGQLPVMSSLIERGRWGMLRSPPGLGDDATWASFATCVAPGRHGRYFHKRLAPGTYATPWFRDHHHRRDPFWKTLSDSGRLVGVLDVPKSPVCDLGPGTQIADWMVHGRDGDTRSWPPRLCSDYLARYGDDRTDRPGSEDFLCHEHALTEDQRLTLLRRLSNGLERKTQAAVELLQWCDWDLFLVVFKESHCVGHEFWHLVDTPEPDGRQGTPVQDVYRALDASIGELLRCLDDAADVILFSDLGMSSNRTAEHLLDLALLRLEAPLVGALSGLYPFGLRLEEKIRKGAFKGTVRSPMRRIRRAFQVDHNEISGAIRINLKGREASGRVEPGSELQDLYASLESALLGLVDPASGRPVVDRVVRTDQRYPGEHRDSLPDLFVIWNRDYPITGLASSKIGVIRAEDPGFRTGNHIADGFYVFSGPSAGSAGESAPASIMDIGPTVASLLGGRLPDVDGQPMGAE